MALDLSEIWDLYGDAFRLHAHQLLAWAYSDVRLSLHHGLDEPSITGLLGDAMKARLDSAEIPEVYDHYVVGDQDPVSPAGQLGNERLRLDLCLTRANVKPRIKYIFEAKRLRTNGFSIGKYVGQSGMGDFIECRYGAGCPEAAMIGLFQDKNAAYWQRELHRIFDKGSLEILGKLQPARVLDNFPNELQSVHRRKDTGPIHLFHIFLDCTTASPSPPFP